VNFFADRKTLSDAKPHHHFFHVMNEINEKVSLWAKLNKQWETMESGLRTRKPRPKGSVGDDPAPMEVESKALRARVDTAFNDAMAAVYDRSQTQHGAQADTEPGLDQKSAKRDRSDENPE
jgi:hypothetical protein